MRSDLYANLYDTEENHWWHRAKRELVGYFIKTNIHTPSPVILDVGCGTGKNMEAFGAFGRTVGLDSSKTAIEYCKKRGLATAVLGSAENMPFSSNKIDIVTALDVIEHIDEHRGLLEIARVLKPGGTLICAVPAFMWLWSEWDVALHHKKRYTKHELINAVEKAGLEVAKCSYAYSFLVLPVFIIRSIKRMWKRKNSSYDSDFNINNRLINIILLFLARLEHILIKMYHVPFGTSVLCIAKKPNSKS